jgi:hypothetical protein
MSEAVIRPPQEGPNHDVASEPTSSGLSSEQSERARRFSYSSPATARRLCATRKSRLSTAERPVIESGQPLGILEKSPRPSSFCPL